MIEPVLSDEVTQALAEDRAVVALESTIFSNLGLPAPANADALELCKQAVVDHGAVPAVAAILDGRPHVGLLPDEEKRVLQGTRKVAERDLAVAQAQRWDVGVTTVSATVALAHAAGISVFATGGIGGVHRGSELSGDVSADLDAIANHPVITVCAGAKAFLDLPRTLEYLETAGVPVLGWQHDWFPAFYTRSSGLPIPHRVDDERVVCDVLRYRARPATGVLLTVPIPVGDEIPAAPSTPYSRPRWRRVLRPESPGPPSHRTSWAGSRRRRTDRASRPTSHWPGTTPASRPGSLSRCKASRFRNFSSLVSCAHGGWGGKSPVRSPSRPA
ncbi:pseudouridine-5'-phosphate glycosidase [Kribbella sp. NBC_00709]|uniref:pseudouridine-5'-phosphate glycosidase n=1 Tax=Kribbella sp. NBC_00709 TaxID=2975972 RepID=UPI003FA5E6D3